MVAYRPLIPPQGTTLNTIEWQNHFQISRHQQFQQSSSSASFKRRIIVDDSYEDDGSVIARISGRAEIFRSAAPHLIASKWHAESNNIFSLDIEHMLSLLEINIRNLADKGGGDKRYWLDLWLTVSLAALIHEAGKIVGDTEPSAIEALKERAFRNDFPTQEILDLFIQHLESHPDWRYCLTINNLLLMLDSPDADTVLGHLNLAERRVTIQNCFKAFSTLQELRASSSNLSEQKSAEAKRLTLVCSVIREVIRYISIVFSGRSDLSERLSRWLNELNCYDGYSDGHSAMLFSHNFPVPIRDRDQLQIDPGFPNIGICLNEASEDNMAFARALQRRGIVNVILMDHYRIRDGVLQTKDYSVYALDRIIRIRNADSSITLDCAVMSASHKAKSGKIAKYYTEEHPEFSRITQDKVLTKRILQAAQVPTANGVKITKISDEAEGLDVSAFLFADSTRNQFVVKPVDGKCGDGVLIFSNQKTKKFYDYCSLNQSRQKQLLLEERIASVPLIVNGSKLDWNLRVFVSRDEAMQWKVSEMLVRFDRDGIAVNISKSAQVMLWDQLADSMGWSPAKRDRIYRQVCDVSLQAVAAIDKEAQKVNEWYGWMQTWVGVDVIVTPQANGKEKPVIIEVNDHHSGGGWDFDNLVIQSQYGLVYVDRARTLENLAWTNYRRRKKL